MTHGTPDFSTSVETVNTPLANNISTAADFSATTVTITTQTPNSSTMIGDTGQHVYLDFVQITKSVANSVVDQIDILDNGVVIATFYISLDFYQKFNDILINDPPNQSLAIRITRGDHAVSVIYTIIVGYYTVII